MLRPRVNSQVFARATGCRNRDETSLPCEFLRLSVADGAWLCSPVREGAWYPGPDLDGGSTARHDVNEPETGRGQPWRSRTRRGRGGVFDDLRGVKPRSSPRGVFLARVHSRLAISTVVVHSRPTENTGRGLLPIAHTDGAHRMVTWLGAMTRVFSRAAKWGAASKRGSKVCRSWPGNLHATQRTVAHPLRFGVAESLRVVGGHSQSTVVVGKN